MDSCVARSRLSNRLYFLTKMVFADTFCVPGRARRGWRKRGTSDGSGTDPAGRRGGRVGSLYYSPRSPAPGVLDGVARTALGASGCVGARLGDWGAESTPWLVDGRFQCMDLPVKTNRPAPDQSPCPPARPQQPEETRQLQPRPQLEPNPRRTPSSLSALGPAVPDACYTHTFPRSRYSSVYARSARGGRGAATVVVVLR